MTGKLPVVQWDNDRQAACGTGWEGFFILEVLL